MTILLTTRDDVQVLSRSEIGLGDIVALDGSDYGTGTVSQIHQDGTVDVFRPYTHTADFSMTGRHEGSSSVICYIGMETVKDMNPKHLKLIRKCRPLR
jgi:hypothetical protein